MNFCTQIVYFKYVSIHKRKFKKYIYCNLDISPRCGSIVKNNRKFGWGITVTKSPLLSTPFSPSVRTPPGSNRPFKRSNMAGLHKFTFSTNNHRPSVRHFTQ